MYSPFVTRLYHWAPVLTVLAEIIILRINILSALEHDWWVAAFRLVVASSVPVSIFIRLLFYVRPWIKATYELHPDSLVIRHGKSEKSVDFSEVQSVKLSHFSPRFFGGFRLTTKSGATIRVFSMLEGQHKILEALHGARAELFSEKQYQSYIQKSSRVGESWGRIRRKLSNWKILVPKYFLAPGLLGFYLAPEAKILVTVAGALAFSSLLGAGLNHLEERFLLTRSPNEIVSQKLDTKVDLASDGVYLLILVVLAYGLSY